MDLVWLIARNHHRDSQMIITMPPTDSMGMESHEDQVETRQVIPVWAAFNSLLKPSEINKDESPLDKVYPLPLINSPAHQWQTLVTALTQLFKLNEYVRKDSEAVPQGEAKPVLVWLDMDLYKRVRKLSFLDPFFGGKIIESPGPFHTVLCALRCLGAMLENSGLDNAWVKAELYSSSLLQ